MVPSKQISKFANKLTIVFPSEKKPFPQLYVSQSLSPWRTLCLTIPQPFYCFSRVQYLQYYWINRQNSELWPIFQWESIPWIGWISRVPPHPSHPVLIEWQMVGCVCWFDINLGQEALPSQQCSDDDWGYDTCGNHNAPTHICSIWWPDLVLAPPANETDMWSGSWAQWVAMQPELFVSGYVRHFID